MRDTMSIIGLYSYDPTIFDSVTALSATVADADGVEHTATIAADKIVDNILSDCAELEVLYTQPDYMKFAIGNWWTRKASIYSSLLETTLYKYDAIANYDRREEWTDDSEGSSTATSNATGKQAGYNSQELVTSDGSDSSGSSSGTSKSKHVGTVSGNIGVTTTQKMIEEQREIVNYCVYDVIIDSFQRRFCLLVY